MWRPHIWTSSPRRVYQKYELYLFGYCINWRCGWYWLWYCMLWVWGEEYVHQIKLLLFWSRNQEVGHTCCEASPHSCHFFRSPIFDTNHVKYNKPLNENYFFSSLKWGGKRHTHTQHLECDDRTSWDLFICSWHWMETTREQPCGLKSRFATLIKQYKANNLWGRDKKAPLFGQRHTERV